MTNINISAFAPKNPFTGEFIAIVFAGTMSVFFFRYKWLQYFMTNATCQVFHPCLIEGHTLNVYHLFK